MEARVTHIQTASDDRPWSINQRVSHHITDSPPTKSMTERTGGKRPDYKELNRGNRVTIQSKEHSTNATPANLSSETSKVSSHQSSSSLVDNSRETEERPVESDSLQTDSFGESEVEREERLVESNSLQTDPFGKTEVEREERPVESNSSQVDSSSESEDLADYRTPELNSDSFSDDEVDLDQAWLVLGSNTPEVDLSQLSVDTLIESDPRGSSVLADVTFQLDQLKLNSTGEILPSPNNSDSESEVDTHIPSVAVPKIKIANNPEEQLWRCKPIRTLQHRQHQVITLLV